MNRYYERNFGKNTPVFNRRYSSKGIYKRGRRSSASVSALEAVLSFIDRMIALICSAKARVAAKAVFGFICLVGVVGIIGRLEMGTLPLLSGVVGLSLIIGLEFLVLRQK